MNIEDPEERAALQQEIQSAIAAGREVGPDMDKHLADSVLDRYAKERAARERAASTKAVVRSAVAAPATQANLFESLGRTVVIVAIAAVAVILTLEGKLEDGRFIGPLIFFFFIFGGSFFRGRRNWHNHHSDRSSRNHYRRNDDMRDNTPRNQSEFV